jgi:hypothetical protein
MTQAGSFELQLSCVELNQSTLQSMTREVAKTLRDQNVGSVSIPAENGARRGAKGDPITLGTIALTLLGSGGVAVSLVQVLKAYVERKATLHFEFTRPDGEKLNLSAENLANKDLQSATAVIEKFIAS